jgi:hypothetical protein
METALVIYPGPDGKDDGAKEQVDPDQAKLDPGRDLIFRYVARNLTIHDSVR